MEDTDNNSFAGQDLPWGIVAKGLTFPGAMPCTNGMVALALVGLCGGPAGSGFRGVAFASGMEMSVIAETKCLQPSAFKIFSKCNPTQWSFRESLPKLESFALTHPFICYYFGGGIHVVQWLSHMWVDWSRAESICWHHLSCKQSSLSPLPRCLHPAQGRPWLYAVLPSDISSPSAHTYIHCTASFHLLLIPAKRASLDIFASSTVSTFKRSTFLFFLLGMFLLPAVMSLYHLLVK